MRSTDLVARNIRRLRVLREISQEALAADSRVERAYMGRLERGGENPTIALLERIADALGVHISELFAKPSAGDAVPKPLKGGRRPAKAKKRKA